MSSITKTATQGDLHEMQELKFGDPVQASFQSHALVSALSRRRSTQADLISDPGPDESTLQSILTIAARVPDHRRVEPFRFILFENEARKDAGQLLEKSWIRENPEASQEERAREAGRFLRSPIIVGVVSSTDPEHRTPEWEQILSAGAVCQNMLLAAGAHGFAAQWLTEWYAYDRVFLEGVGVKDHENIAGFIYIGTAKTNPKERKRPDVSLLISRFQQDG